MMHVADNKADRAIRDRAYKLAESGQYEAVRDVERALVGEGWPNARRIVQSEYMMQALEEKCRAARHAASH
ncbi:MAG: hypothetical protein AB7E05_08605 [Sphingobium sp.]